jgi:N-acetylmuramoyl-L-alanine amidase
VSVEDHYRLLFPSNYICAADLRGKDVTLTIAKVAKEELVRRGGSVEVKPVVTFEKAQKRLVLARTNAETIAEIHGPDTSMWTGKQVTLYPTTTKMGPKTVDCIRIRGAK